MDLTLVNQELSESRLFRTTNQFKNLTGRDIADLLYLTSLTLYLLHKDDKQHEYSKSYAQQTTSFGPYTLFRTHATDLYMLAHVVNDKFSSKVKMNKNMESKRFLKTLSFNNRTHYQFFVKLKNSSISDVQASPYFFRLESQLKIKDPRYKQWRRLLMDWEKLKFSQRQYVTTQILQEYRRKGRAAEMVSTLSTMVKYRNYSVSTKYAKDPDKVSKTRRVAGTVAGAAVGRYAGKKLAQRTGANVDKYKKAGTGIGAIAGYWASGRKRQKWKLTILY